MSEEKVMRGDDAGNGDGNETWKRSIAGEYGPLPVDVSFNVFKAYAIDLNHLFSQRGYLTKERHL